MRRIWLALLLVGSSALNTFAQGAVDTDALPRWFVGGGMILDVDRSWEGSAPAAIGGTALAAVDVTQHLGFRLMIDVPPFATTIEEFNAGPFRSTLIEHRRNISRSVLIDLHGQPLPRVRLGFLVGVSLARRTVHNIDTTDEVTADGRVVRIRQYDHVDIRPSLGGLTLGAEGAISLTDHLAIVADVRATALGLDSGRMLILRPGVSLRLF